MRTPIVPILALVAMAACGSSPGAEGSDLGIDLPLPEAVDDPGDAPDLAADRGGPGDDGSGDESAEPDPGPDAPAPTDPGPADPGPDDPGPVDLPPTDFGPEAPHLQDPGHVDAGRPALARLSGGGYALAWQARTAAGDPLQVFARCLDDAGQPTGEVLAVSGAGEADRRLPAIAGLAAGGFVVAWQQEAGEAPSTVRFRRFPGCALAPDADVAASTWTGGDWQANASVAGLADGSWVVAWDGSCKTGGCTTRDGSWAAAAARRFTSEGPVDAGGFVIEQMAIGDQSVPDVAPRPDGGFVAAFVSAGSVTSLWDIRARDFDGEGTGGDDEIVDDQAGSQVSPAIAALSGGGSVVAWTDRTEDGLAQEVRARMRDPEGEPVGTAFPVAQSTAGRRGLADVAPWTDGGFVAAWTAVEEARVYARWFAADGSPRTRDRPVSAVVDGPAGRVTIAVDGLGGGLAAWSVTGEDGLPVGIQARMLPVDAL